MYFLHTYIYLYDIGSLIAMIVFKNKSLNMI